MFSKKLISAAYKSLVKILYQMPLLRKSLISILKYTGIFPIFLQLRLGGRIDANFWRSCYLNSKSALKTGFYRTTLHPTKQFLRKFPRSKFLLLNITRHMGLLQFLMKLRNFGESGSKLLTLNDPHQHLVFHGKITILGEQLMTRSEWEEKKLTMPIDLKKESALSKFTKNAEIPYTKYKGAFAPKITVLSSLFRSEKYLDTFLGNLTEQTIFHEMEIVLILVEPSTYERDLASEFADRFDNVKLFIESKRISIYRAWNLGIVNSVAPYLTNINADDLRRSDSIEIQVKTLDDESWIDVVYQDVLYSLDREMSWPELEFMNYRSNLGPVAVGSLMAGFNYPHNAPAWRRILHDELGLFNEDFQSAGDYEFWLRCAFSGKKFFKVRDSHICYYINPEGMSTRIGGPGAIEGAQVQSMYLAKIRSLAYGKWSETGIKLGRFDNEDEILFQTAVSNIINFRNE